MNQLKTQLKERFASLRATAGERKTRVAIVASVAALLLVAGVTAAAWALSNQSAGSQVSSPKPSISKSTSAKPSPSASQTASASPSASQTASPTETAASTEAAPAETTSGSTGSNGNTGGSTGSTGNTGGNAVPPPPPPPAPVYDNCPNGDYTGSTTDGSCGAPPVVYDNCPNGDYTGSNTDGSCGSKPVSPATANAASCVDNGTNVQVSFSVNNPDGASFTASIQIGGRTKTFAQSNAAGTIPYTYTLSGAGTCAVGYSAWVS